MCLARLQLSLSLSPFLHTHTHAQNKLQKLSHDDEVLKLQEQLQKQLVNAQKYNTSFNFMYDALNKDQY